MAKQLKRLDLLIKEVIDPHAQENFWRLKNYIDELAKSGLVGSQGPQGPPGPAGPSGSTTDADFAGALKVTRVANATIVKGDALYAVSSTHVDLASANTSLGEATVFGFALNNADPSEDVEVLILGVLEDAVFSVFTLNSPLFLDVTGGITDTKRTSGYHVVVGKALGANQIFITIRDPLVIA